MSRFPNWWRMYLYFLLAVALASAVAFVGVALQAWLGALGFVIYASAVLFVLAPIAFYKL